MPTAKFRSFEEAADALLHRPEGRPPAVRVRALFEFARRMTAPRRIAGVVKYRSFEEAARDRVAPDRRRGVP